MKILIIFLSPFMFSLFLYFLSLFLGFDYCGRVKDLLAVIKFAGVSYFTDDVFVCLNNGAMLNAFILFSPIFIYIYIILDVERVVRVGRAVSISKTLLASLVLLVGYISIFVVPLDAYSTRGRAIIDFVFSQQLVFYVFLVFPCMLLSGMWALCLKLKFFQINKEIINGRY